MSKRKPKVGDIVEVSFLDHAENMDAPPKCLAWGRLHEQGDGYMVLLSWTGDDDDFDPDKQKHDTHRHLILCPVVLGVEVIKPRVDT